MTERLHIGTHKGLFELARHNGVWDIVDVQFLGDPVSAVLPDTDGIVYAALDLGHFGAKLWRRDPTGNWRELPVPAFPPKPEDAGDDPHPWSLGKIWALEPGGVPGRVWAGTMPGGLFRTDDGGESWSLNEALWHMPERRQWFGVAGGEQPGINSVLIDPRNPSDIRVGVSCAGLWASTDAGASWQIINHGMYNENMPPERREDQLVPDTAWFVPAIKDERRVPVDGKVVVSRTRDGGRSFEVLRKGLPQRHAYDLVWRHALAVDETGELLAFGSTSGGLWISENGGDSWTMPEARLPPIAAVRFAPAEH